MKTTANFLNSKVLFSNPGTNYLVVSVQAPAVKAAAKRRPLCIVASVDVSSSMAGPKIDYARKSVMKLIDHLQPGDFFGIATFGTDAVLVAPPTEMTQDRKEQLKVQVGKLHAYGNTNLSGGMTVGLEAITKLDLSAEYLSRVILFTDGQPNQGIAISRKDIVELAKNTRGHVSISGFGYGFGCDNDLLADLASSSDGNFAFIANPDDALSAFGKELGGLASVYAQDLVVDIKPVGDHELVEVISDVDVEQVDKGVRIKLSDILAEERRDLVVAVKFSDQTKATPRPVNIFDISLTYQTLDNGKLVSKTETTKAKVEFVKDGNEDQADKKLDAIVDLAKVTAAQVEAEKLAQNGDFRGAAQSLETLSSNFMAAGKAGMNNVTQTLGATYSSSNAYSTSSGMRNSSMSYGTRGMTASSVAGGVTELYDGVLATAGATVSNSTQDSTSASFIAGEIKPVVAVSDSMLIDLAAAGLAVKSAPAKADPKTARKSKSKRW